MAEQTCQAAEEVGICDFDLALQPTSSEQSESLRGNNGNDNVGCKSPRPENPKRPKIDKDGFVTPATPEIPKTSMYLIENTEGFAFSPDKRSTTPPDIEQRVISEHSSGERRNIDPMGELSQNVLGNSPGAATASRDANMSLTIDGASMDPPQPPKSVSDLLKELGQEAKMLNLQWSQVLSESENVELFCPTRLEKILEEALALEEHLKSQKERLRLRLQALSRTLQLL